MSNVMRDAISKAFATYLAGDHEDAWVKVSRLDLEAMQRQHSRDSEIVIGPVSMLLWCPECSERHIDAGEFETKSHHTHACQNCGHVWRPAIVATRGVQFLPGFKNAVTP